MSNSLSAVHPELVAEWSDRNLPLTPDSICLTVEEAAAYSGIGERRLKALLMDKDCSFRIARSDRLLIIREKLEEFIDSSTEL